MKYVIVLIVGGLITTLADKLLDLPPYTATMLVHDALMLGWGAALAVSFQ
jgi:hypothetical protein